MAKAPLPRKLVAQNRKARHEFFISDTFEAGLVLTGTEVKSLRGPGVQIADAYADPRGGEMWLVNAHIPEYAGGNRLIGTNRFFATTQNSGIASFQTQPGSIGSHIRTGFIDDADHTERHAHLANLNAGRAEFEISHIADRIR